MANRWIKAVISRGCRAGLLVGSLVMMSPVQAETLVIITGEWPPYTGVREPQGGSVTAVVRQAFAAAGVEAKVGFFPWHRLEALVATPHYAAKFPDYYSPVRAARCHFSLPVGESPLGLAERRRQPLIWQTVDDLVPWRIGTVSSYVNTPAFDQLIKSGRLQTLAVSSDEENLRNLMAGKVDAAVIDRNVYAYLLGDARRIAGASQQLQLSQRVLIMHRMYVCFPKTEKGRQLRDRFNRGLQELQAPAP